MQISWQVQHFVNLHVQISWLHVQISWQAQYKMRCGEIANARNAAFFNGTGGSEAGKSRSAERRLRDGLGSCSGMVGIVRPLGLEAGTCTSVNLHAQISWQAQHFVNLHVQISWQVQHFVNLHVQTSSDRAQLFELVSPAFRMPFAFAEKTTGFPFAHCDKLVPLH